MGSTILSIWCNQQNKLLPATTKCFNNSYSDCRASILLSQSYHVSLVLVISNKTDDFEADDLSALVLVYASHQI